MDAQGLQGLDDVTISAFKVLLDEAIAAAKTKGMSPILRPSSVEECFGNQLLRRVAVAL